MRFTFSDYEEVFTPGAPVLIENFFFGREKETKELKRNVRRKGFHPFIIGNRGVGKTSLVHLALANSKNRVIKITCNSRMTYLGFAKSLLKELGVAVNEVERTTEGTKKISGSIKPFKTGISAEGNKKHISKKTGFDILATDPWSIFQVIHNLGEKIIFVIDEYDRITPQKKKFHTSIADLIKTLADNSTVCGSRIIVVGVGYTASDLIGVHESIERSAPEIYLKPLHVKDITDFLTEAEKKLKFRFEPEVKRYLAEGSNGYPYFVHLVGLESVDAMVDREAKSRVVTIRDYLAGLREAVRKAFQSELRKYRAAVSGMSTTEIIIVKQLCQYPLNARIFRRKFRKSMKLQRVMTENVFDSAWIKLKQERRLVYTDPQNEIIRFSDPLMAPFLKGWFFRQDILKNPLSEQLSLFE